MSRLLAAVEASSSREMEEISVTDPELICPTSELAAPAADNDSQMYPSVLIAS
jgi:hypothetical protein